MKILLTGSSGWLGRFLAPLLRKRGHTVLGLDIAPGADTQLVGSVADRALIDRAFSQGVEGVIHAGALHKPDIARYPAQAFVDVNITGTLNLLEAAREARLKHFVFTSTTSLMISNAIRNEQSDDAEWLDETRAPLVPRNIYGVTKLAAETLCRLYADEHGLPSIVLRTGRFFPEDDDTLTMPSGENLKANEFLNRRLTVEDAADAHIAAMEHAPRLGFDTFIVSAPTPFSRTDVKELKRDPQAIIARLFPDAREFYQQRGWVLPRSIGRVYDASRAEERMGFRCATDFAAILSALREGRALPFAHDPTYVSPKETLEEDAGTIVRLSGASRSVPASLDADQT